MTEAAIATTSEAETEGRANVLPVRVYYEDTDAGGIVFYGRYLAFAERGRTELLRELGFENGELQRRDGLAFAVRSCAIEYLRPALLDDSLEIHTRVLKIGGASLQMKQDVCRNGDVISELDVKMVCMHVSGPQQGKPSRIPAEVRVALEKFSGLKSEK